jgi:hypothetical protein
MLRHQTTIDDVFDEYGLLKDGAVYRCRMSMRDAMAERSRSRLHDGHGNPPGRRPGFIVGDRARDGSHYAEYDFQISRRYLDQDDPPTGAGSDGLRGQKPGDLCTIKGYAGRLRTGPDGTLVCVPTQSFRGLNGSPDDDDDTEPNLEIAQSDRRKVADVQKSHALTMQRLYDELDRDLMQQWRRK